MICEIRTKIVLINPPSLCVEDDRLEMPLGLLYIAAALREADYSNLTLYDMSGCKSEKEINECIRGIPEAKIYGISTLCTNYEYAKRIVEYIRNINSLAYIVMGGANPSAMPEFTIKSTGVNVVIVGEGEDAFVNCVKSYTSKSPIEGIIHGISRKNIDTYPFPARDLANMDTYTRKLLGENIVSLISSRGCRYKCIHCNSVVMGGGAHIVRYRSPDNVIEEIELLRNSYMNFRFNDDHFTGNPALIEMLEKLAVLDIKFRVFARIEDLTYETCRALKRAGCVHVSVGLESLNPANLKSLGKTQQIGKEYNVKAAKDMGLTVRSFFMVGLPYDTDMTIEKYFIQAAELGLDEFSIYPLIPYPGCMIFKHPEDFGYTIVNNNFRDYVQVGINGKTCFALQHKNFGPKDVERWSLKAKEILSEHDIKCTKDSVVAR